MKRFIYEVDYNERRAYIEETFRTLREAKIVYRLLVKRDEKYANRKGYVAADPTLFRIERGRGPADTDIYERLMP